MGKWIIKTKSGYLNGFYPNGLPVGRKLEYIEEYNGLYPKLKLSEVILQSGGAIIFDSEVEANNYIQHIREEINQNKQRYEGARPGSACKLMELVSTFKAIPITA